MTATTTPVLYNIPEWIDTNKQYFLPPVCNKMMHNDGQCKLFFVGGPNQRKDYHIDCGEELFFQLKGDMCLKLVELGKHRDQPIREGEIFLLPALITHSPQRFANTVGLVVERDRDVSEKDGLRYFVEENGKATTQSLYEAWFHCTDLGTQLAPVMKQFFESEQYKTGKPVPGFNPAVPPHEVDYTNAVERPFKLQDWIDRNRDELNSKGRLPLFDTNKYQLQVYMYGAGEVADQSNEAEPWMWQWEGTSVVTVAGKDYTMKKDNSLLIPQGQKFVVKQKLGSTALLCYQDPTKAATWPKKQ